MGALYHTVQDFYKLASKGGLMKRRLFRNLLLTFFLCAAVLAGFMPGMQPRAVADTNAYMYSWNGSAWVPISLPLAVASPAPAPTVSPGLVNGAVILGPSTAPAVINGTYTLVVDSNGRTATRFCDATTSTQCLAVSAGGVASVTTPAPAPTVSPGLFTGVTNVGPSTAPAAINGAYTQVVNSNGYTGARVCDASSTSCAALTGAGNQDANTGTFNSLSISNYNLGYNGSGWDRLRSAANGGTGVLATALNSSGAAAPVACDKFAAVNISSATTTSIVAVSGSKAVYICGYHLYVVSGTLPSFQFEYGTGAACSSPTVMSGTFGGIAGAIGESFEIGSGVGAILQTPASQGFCIVTGGTTPNLQGFVTYSQF